MKDAAPGDAKQPEGQQWFIPFTQPTAAVFKLKHSKGKKANVPHDGVNCPKLLHIKCSTKKLTEIGHLVGNFISHC